MSGNVEATGKAQASVTGANVFQQFPPILPMLVIAIVLVAMVQFPSTARFATAFAWLIFVAVLFADGSEAFKSVGKQLAGGKATGSVPIPAGTDPRKR